MSNTSSNVNSNWTQRFVVLLVVLTCLKVWVGPMNADQPAAAQSQVVDPGEQRLQLLAAANRTNELLAEIKQLLTSHIFNVTLKGADNQSVSPVKSRGPGHP